MVDWSTLQLDDVKGFVLSRVDGRTTLAEIVLLAPFPEAQTIAILGELFARNVIDLPGVPRWPAQSAPSPVAAETPRAATTPSPPASKAPTPPPVVPPSPSAARVAAAPPPRGAAMMMRPHTPPPHAAATQSGEASPADDELSREVRARIDEMLAIVDDEARMLEPHHLFGVLPGADRKEIKRAYFKLSKEFHPDRYFKKNLGDYKRRLQRIFNAIKDAYEKMDEAARS